MLTPIPANDVEANLSYAYLHAIAARAGATCRVGDRDEDNKGIDASLRIYGPFANAVYRKTIQIDIQLKATIGTPADKGDHLSYSFKGKARYDNLREPCESTPVFLIVMFLPDEPARWMEHSPDALLLRKCAYWVSLRDAPEFTNETRQVVYLPKSQVVTPEALHALAGRIAVNDFPRYGGLSSP